MQNYDIKLQSNTFLIKKFFNEKNVRTSKLNKDLVLSLYSAVFIKNIHKTVDVNIFEFSIK